VYPLYTSPHPAVTPACRYFTKDELRRVFALGPAGTSDAMHRLHAAHGTSDAWARRLAAAAPTAEAPPSALARDLLALDALFPAAWGLLVGTSPHDALYSVLEPGSAIGDDAAAESDRRGSRDHDDESRTRRRPKQLPNPQGGKPPAGKANAKGAAPSERRGERGGRRQSAAVLVVDNDFAGGDAAGVIVIEESDGEEEPWSGGGGGPLALNDTLSEGTWREEDGQEASASEAEAEEAGSEEMQDSGDSEPSDGETLGDESRSTDEDDDEANDFIEDEEEEISDDSSVVIDLSGLNLSDLAEDVTVAHEPPLAPEPPQGPPIVENLTNADPDSEAALLADVDLIDTDEEGKGEEGPRAACRPSERSRLRRALSRRENRREPDQAPRTEKGSGRDGTCNESGGRGGRAHGAAVARTLLAATRPKAARLTDAAALAAWEGRRARAVAWAHQADEVGLAAGASSDAALAAKATALRERALGECLEVSGGVEGRCVSFEVREWSAPVLQRIALMPRNSPVRPRVSCARSKGA
jgi:hypothetical protein